MAYNPTLSFGKIFIRTIWQALFVLSFLIGQGGQINAHAAAVQGIAIAPAPQPALQPPPKSNFAPAAAVTFSGLPATPFLGQTVSFSVTFSNSGDATGYGPFIDLVIPASQGLGTTTISASYQGVGFTNNVDLFVNTFNASGQTTHPLVRDSSGNFITVNAPSGAGQDDKLVTIRLPFGSYTPGQPPISVDVTVNMAVPPAQVGVAIPIWARGGYQYGSTPLDDWCCDAPIVAGTWESSTATPTLWTLSKSYSGPEDEAASGPNFTGFYPMQYTLAVDIAPGQTITNLTLSDVVPDNLQPVSWVATNGASCSPNPLNTASPGDTIQCTFASATNHAEVIFDFYIPLTDLGGVRVIDPDTGLAVTSCNNATADGTWNGNPLPQLSTGSAPSSCGHTLNDRSIAIQKSAVVVGGGIVQPGAIIQNTLNFQISDYFAFDNITILDIVSDGQHFFTDGSHPVTLQINGNGYSFGPGTYNSANYDITCYYSSPGGECTSSFPSNSGNPDEYGTTQLTFDVTSEIISATGSAQDGKLIGGCVNPAGGSATPNCGTYNNGPTSGQIVFYTQVLDNFVNNYPSGDASVDEGDILTNIGRHIQGDVLDTNTLSPVVPLSQPQDGSSAELTAPLGTLTKSVYAINGNTSLSSPVHINPGDDVTYRLEYTLPIGNEENMRFTDYLPLPIFNVSDPAADGSVSSWTFSTTPGTMSPGVVSLGTSDDFYQYMLDGVSGSTGTVTPTTNPSSSGDPLYHDATTTPNVVIDTATNSVSVTYPNYDDTRLLTDRKVDLLITATVNNEPFADQLYLTNEAYSFEGSTNGGISSATKIVLVVVDEPVLVTKKSAVWAGRFDGTNWLLQTQAAYNPALPGGTPILDPTNQPRWTGTITSAAPYSSDISHVDANDVVTFMIVIEDQGHSDKGAFDITIKDTLPSIFQVPTTPQGLNLHIYHGDGSGADYGSGEEEIRYTGLGGAPAGTTSPSGDLFGNGLSLTDPADVSGVGAVCQAETVGPGKNVIVITYDLQIKPGVAPGTYPNTAEITGYASQNNGPNFVGAGGGSQDTANTTIDASPSKYLVTTSEAFTTGNNVAIGEIVRYRLVSTIPEGDSANFQLRDILPAGLTFLNDGTATFAFVSNNGITTSDAGLAALSACNLSGSSADGTTPSIPGGCNLPGANISNSISTDTDTYNTGTDVYFKFGDLTNSDNDLDSEYVIVEFNALVDNSPNGGNTAANNYDGRNVGNRARVYINGAISGSDSSTVNVLVQEANLTLNKQATTISATIDAGNVVTYTVTIENLSANGSHLNAYDVHFTDTLPSPALTFKQFVSVSGGTGVTNNSSGNSIDFTFDSIALGDTVTIVYEATISTTATDITASQAIDNQADLTWTSLAGEYGTTTNGTGSSVTAASGDTNGERNGTSSPTYVNTYHKNAVETVTVTAPTISKLAPDPLTYRIGETIDYYLLVTLPEGVTESLVVKDQLPAGLGYVSSKVITTVADADNPPAPDSRRLTQDYNGSFTTSGTCQNAANNPCTTGDTNQTLSFLFGDTTTTGSGPIEGSTNNQFLLLVRAQVLNVSGNQPGTTLTNTATLDYLVGSTTTTVQGGQQTVTVIGPYLTLDKQATSLSAHPDSGDTITYTVTINAPSGSNRSNAYDVHYTDTLPSVVSLDNASVSVSGATHGYTDNSNYASNLVDVSITEIDINETVTITYTATVLIAVAPNETIDNTGEIEWTSLPGNVSGERTGADQDTGGVNDYYQSSTASVTSLDITAEKSIVGSSQTFTSIAGDNLSAEAAIGEVLRYRLAVILPEGTSSGFQLKDTLPVGFTYVGSPKLSFVANSPITVDSGHSDLSSANNNAVPPTFNFPNSYVTVAGQDLTFDLGDLVNNDNDSGDELVVLDFDVLVNNGTNNDAFDSSKLTKINNFTVEIGGSTAGQSNDVTATIVESRLTVTKTVSDLHPGPGETVTYTLAFQNTSPSTTTAYDVVLTDQIDTNLTLDQSSIQVTPTGWTPSVTDNSTADKIDLTFATVPVGGSVIVTYKATVNAGVTQNTTIQNTVNLTWTSLPGEVTGERTGTIGQTTAPDNYFATAGVNLDVLRALDKFVASGSVPDDGNSPTIFPPTLPDVYIGEILNYNIVLTVPPGDTLSASVTDTLDRGLAFVSCTSITPQSTDLTTDLSGAPSSDFSPACDDPTNPTISPTGSSNPADDGREIVFTLGNLHNANSGSQTLTIAFQAVVLNSEENKSGTTFSNNVRWEWDSGAHFLTASSETLTVKESKLQIEKTIDPAIAPLDSIVTFTLNVSHSSESQADAYDALVTDSIPTNLAINPASVTVVGSANLPTPVVTVSGNVLTVYWRQFQLGETAEITFTAQFIGPSPARNTATVQWSSIQIDPRPASQEQSNYNTLSTERRYIPNDQVNDYRAEATDTLIVPKLPKTGFAPDVTTQLPAQPDDKTYTDLGDFWVEIPRLGIKIPIVGIPLSADGWDLTWLWDEAGYLDGTAYPTHAGNSAITAHVYLPDGKPGPFVNLNTLQWGDQVIVHAFGLRYIYEVRQVLKTSPKDLSILAHEDYPWLTLITCQDYNEAQNSYQYRIAVRAVLIRTAEDNAQH